MVLTDRFAPPQALADDPRVQVVSGDLADVVPRLFAEPVDPGLATWAADYLNDRLVGVRIGSRTVKLAFQEPELTAPVAAVHLSASDIDLQALLPDHRSPVEEIVLALRDLGGRYQRYLHQDEFGPHLL